MPLMETVLGFHSPTISELSSLEQPVSTAAVSSSRTSASIAADFFIAKTPFDGDMGILPLIARFVN